MSILTAFAFAAFALELEYGGLDTTDEAPEFGDATFFGDTEASLGDFVIVKQWDATGAALPETETQLGDFVIVRQWDFTDDDELIDSETATSLGDFVVVKQWDLADSDVLLLADEGAFYDWLETHPQNAQSDRFGLELDGIKAALFVLEYESSER